MADVRSGLEESATVAFAPACGAAPIGVTGPQALLALVPTFLHGWEFRSAGHAAAVIICRRGQNGIAITAPVLPGGVYATADLVEAADVVAAALAALAARGERVILPHAGAVEAAAGLILLLADTTGGKSTLALTLAAYGWRFFADDRLGLSAIERHPLELRLALRRSCDCPCRNLRQGWRNSRPSVRAVESWPSPISPSDQRSKPEQGQGRRSLLVSC